VSNLHGVARAALALADWVVEFLTSLPRQPGVAVPPAHVRCPAGATVSAYAEAWGTGDASCTPHTRETRRDGGAWRARTRDEPEGEAGMGMRQSSTPVERVDVSAYTGPTDGPDADGAYAWDSTTMVVAQVPASGASSRWASARSAASAAGRPA
jgi:hypothetical protein